MKRPHTRTGNYSFGEQTLSILFQALDASVSGIILTDHQLPDNPIIYCNKSFELMTGYDRHEIIGHNCRFLQGADRDQDARRLIKRAMAAEQSCVVTIRNYKKDGTLFWNELYMSPITGEDGRTAYFIGVQNDITKRKQAEDEVRFQQASMEKTIIERTRSIKEKEQYLESILQTVRESLIVLDSNLHVLSVNVHFLKIFKVTQEETLHHHLYELGNGQWNIPKLKKLLEDILPTNNPVENFEVEHDFPHIGKKVMLLNAYRVELEGDYKDRILIAIEDVTNKKDMEQRKDDFLSVASHELKTPLTTLKGYIQLMQETAAEECKGKFDGYLLKTAEHVDRLTLLVNDLLDVSKMQAGKVEISPAYFSFDTMIRDNVENFSATGNGHQFVVRGEASDHFFGDRDRLQQVVVNLLSNAIKYSPTDSTIEIYLSKVSDYIKVAVSDKGLGVKPEDKFNIFKRFYRSEHTHELFPGMGIGLYVSRQIIEKHGGSIWVESEPGEGSIFSFTLPVDMENQHEHKAAEQAGR